METKPIYICKYLTDQSEQIALNIIYTDDMPKLVRVYKEFEVNFKRREEKLGLSSANIRLILVKFICFNAVLH